MIGKGNRCIGICISANSKERWRCTHLHRQVSVSISNYLRWQIAVSIILKIIRAKIDRSAIIFEIIYFKIGNKMNISAARNGKLSIVSACASNSMCAGCGNSKYSSM